MLAVFRRRATAGPLGRCTLATGAPRRRMLMMPVVRRAALAAGAMLALPVAAVAIGTQVDERVSRTVNFWRQAFPVYIHYRMTERMMANAPKEEQDAAFEKLHERYAPVMLDIILGMRGFYIKIGQIGSTRADFMPRQYLERLSTLQSNVPSEPLDYVRGIVEEELGCSLEEAFAEFDAIPLGAASIGQAHRARLHDGREVVVKVKFPAVERNFESDMTTITSFCRLAQPEHVPFLKEVKKQFMTEFNYLSEAHNLEEVGANMRRNFSRTVTVPQPINELCTRDVLVMEYLDGVKLIDAIKDFYGGVARKRGMTLAQLQAEYRALGKTGPSEQTMAQYEWTAWAKAKTCNTAIAAYNWTLGWVVRPLAYVEPELVINVPRILRHLVEVHGHQILIDGVFNGDPHPGNIMLLRDGRLGLIDYGQVKRINDYQRRLFAEMIVALADDDKERIVDVHRRMGFRTEKDDKEVSYDLSRLAFDRDDRESTRGMNIQQYFEHIGSRDRIVAGADEFVMASRVSILLRGMGTHLMYPLRMSHAWLALAKRVLQETAPPPQAALEAGTAIAVKGQAVAA